MLKSHTTSIFFLALFYHGLIVHIFAGFLFCRYWGLAKHEDIISHKIVVHDFSLFRLPSCSYDTCTIADMRVSDALSSLVGSGCRYWFLFVFYGSCGT